MGTLKKHEMGRVQFSRLAGSMMTTFGVSKLDEERGGGTIGCALHQYSDGQTDSTARQ